MTRVWLALGSNLGDRDGYLQGAREALGQAGITVTRQSHVAETEPVGVTDQPRFLNQVLEVDWPGTPRQLLRAIQAVEREGGRVRTKRWGPRTIDVDILLFGDEHISEPDLQVPHPRIAERAFVLEGLRELRESG